MVDRASASIIIGGALPLPFLDDFLAAAEADYGMVGWDEGPVTAAVIDGCGSLEICAYDLSGGIFDALESFCVEHRLPFVRSSGSCSGVFGPERVVYDGVTDPEAFETSEGDAVLIDLATILRLGSLAAVEAWFARADFTPPPLMTVAQA